MHVCVRFLNDYDIKHNPTILVLKFYAFGLRFSL